MLGAVADKALPTLEWRRSDAFQLDSGQQQIAERVKLIANFLFSSRLQETDSIVLINRYLSQITARGVFTKVKCCHEK